MEPGPIEGKTQTRLNDRRSDVFPGSASAKPRVLLTDLEYRELACNAEILGYGKPSELLDDVLDEWFGRGCKWFDMGDFESAPGPATRPVALDADKAAYFEDAAARYEEIDAEEDSSTDTTVRSILQDWMRVMSRLQGKYHKRDVEDGPILEKYFPGFPGTYEGVVAWQDARGFARSWLYEEFPELINRPGGVAVIENLPDGTRRLLDPEAFV